MTDAFQAGTDHDELSAYLDDELTPSERVDVERRLAESPALRAELDEVRVARDAMRGLPTREAPAGFWDDVITDVRDADVEAGHGDAEAAPVGDLDARRRRLRRFAVFAGAAAAAAAVIAVVLIPGRTSVRPNVTAVATQHAASSSDLGDSISSLAPVGPLVGRR
jgi:anti-sigma factor RsiW